MACHFINTFDGFAVLDDVGVKLSGLKAVRCEARNALTEMVREGPAKENGVQFRADVRDERNNHVMTLTLLMVVDVHPCDLGHGKF